MEAALPHVFRSPVEPLPPSDRLEELVTQIPDILGLTDRGERQSILLICCGKRKLASTARADELYTSPRSRLSILLASSLKRPFRIVSAQYGLLCPDALVTPYDVDLSDLEGASLHLWKQSLGQTLSKSFDRELHKFVVLGSGVYAQSLRELLIDLRFEVNTPLLGLSTGQQVVWLKKANRVVDRLRDLQALYSNLALLKERGGLRTLSDTLSTNSLPAKGVYLFLDPSEPSLVAPGSARVVRIGTHAVSEGSKATLRNRLRTHRGTEAGAGNHRSSIFRLHVGSALKRTHKKFERHDNWGIDKTYNADVLVDERPLEEAVSNYLSRLQVAIIPIDDAATKLSLRRHVERNLVALFTEDRIILDRPTHAWLGERSPKSTIQASGLWNVNDVFSSYDPKVLRLIRWD